MSVCYIKSYQSHALYLFAVPHPKKPLVHLLSKAIYEVSTGQYVTTNTNVLPFLV